MRLPTKIGTILLAVFCANANADNTTIDFETLVDLSSITDQYVSLGVSFSNGTALQAGQTLNEIDFPPHSGSLVAGDDSSNPLEISFSTGASGISAWLTYSQGLRIDVFDTANQLLGSVVAPNSSNLGTSDLFSFNFTDVGRLSFQGTPLGTYVLDDLAFSTAPIPEPSSAYLIVVGLGLLAAIKKSQSAKSAH